MRSIFLLVVLLFPFATSAQEPLLDVMSDHPYFGPAHFKSAQDSAEFTQFRQGLTTVGRSATESSGTYRMLWREHQQGGYWVVERCDGTVLDKRTTKDMHGLFGPHIPFRTADGRSGWMVIHERPCALICRSATYYVKEEMKRYEGLPYGPEP